MKSQRELVDYLLEEGILETSAIAKAFRAIDRADFMTDEYRAFAYADQPFPHNENQTISQPTRVAIMLEELQPKAGDKVLDIGSGSGWTTALLAEIVGPKGSVIGIEKEAELVEFGRQSLAKYNLPNAQILPTGPLLGHPAGMPYDKILVSASASRFPQELPHQLRFNGRLIIPVENSLEVFERNNDILEHRSLEGLTFVPLT